MNNKKLLVGNLKMYMDTRHVISYLENLKEIDLPKELVLCPTNIYLPYFLELNCNIGVQNVAYEEGGAYTGEVSAYQLHEMNVKYAIVGHSERRIYFKETNEEINQKIRQCLNANIVPILCIGETQEEFESGNTKNVIRKQIIDCLFGFDETEINNVVIAYEPVWAIGSGKIPDNNQIDDVVKYIKEVVDNVLKCHDINVLYGGSVSSKNIETLEKLNYINGYLIGKSATDYQEILKMVDFIFS